MIISKSYADRQGNLINTISPQRGEAGILQMLSIWKEAIGEAQIAFLHHCNDSLTIEVTKSQYISLKTAQCPFKQLVCCFLFGSGNNEISQIYQTYSGIYTRLIGLHQVWMTPQPAEVLNRIQFSSEVCVILANSCFVICKKTNLSKIKVNVTNSSASVFRRMN